MRNSEKLTVVLDPETRDALREWAYEDGGRSLCSLLRKIVAKSLRSIGSRRQTHRWRSNGLTGTL